MVIASASPPVTAATTHPAERYFAAGGARLRYRDEGHGPVVLLVHGWTLDLEMWDPQVAALRDAFRLVRLDRRGHGLSTGNPDSTQDAADLAALCRQLDLTSVALVGMSQGARGVLGFAGVAPAQVWAIILDGPPAFERSDAEDDVPLARFQSLVRLHGMESFRREWARHTLMQLRTGDHSSRALLSAMIQRYPGRDLLHPTSLALAPTQPALIRAPMLILNGDCDLPGRVQAARELCARLPSAVHHVIADAGHLPNLDQPNLYSALCREFLARHQGKSP